MLGMSIDLKNRRLLQMKADLNGGTLLLYTDSRPLTGEPTTGQTIVASMLLPDPIGSVLDDTLTFNAVAPSIAVGTGLATWGRVIDVNADFVMDLDVSDLSGSGDIKFDNINFIAGSDVAVNSAVIKEA